MDFKGWKEIPQEIRDKMQFCVGIKVVNERTVTAYAEHWATHASGTLTLSNVLVDTSLTAPNGFLVDPCFTHVDWIVIGGSHAWTLRPIALEEK